ncbi:MAG TPA: ferredoxin reductase [Chloroflexota bacterium]
MERTGVLGRLIWQVGHVAETRTETPHVKSLILELPKWPGHRTGQHVDIRLTAEDGYQAVRSYSIASPPEEHRIEVTIERLKDGGVSPYLTDDVQVGDPLEVRGPIGGYFVWDVAFGGLLFLVSEGSGIVPLMAMIRHRVATGNGTSIRLLYSARSPEAVTCQAELEELASWPGIEVMYTYTRVQPPGWTGYRRRIDQAMLQEVAPSRDEAPRIYICGPTPLAEGTANALVALGDEPARIRIERFGPTGR